MFPESEAWVARADECATSLSSPKRAADPTCLFKDRTHRRKCEYMTERGRLLMHELE
jgi:hypothetical protein